jgi:Cys-rich protein (TIGR01571 family)
MSNPDPQEWQNGLCNCTPCDACCLSTFLPCMLYGRTASRLRHGGNDPESANGDCAVFCGVHVLTGCGFIMGMMKRTEIRERYGIKGSGCGDCCVSFWCLCCTLIQQDKEVRDRERARGAMIGVDATGYQPYGQQMNMSASPPTYQEPKPSQAPNHGAQY